MGYIELEVAKQLKDIRKCYSKLATAIDDEDEVKSTYMKTAIKLVKWYVDLIHKHLIMNSEFKVKHLRAVLEASDLLAQVCEDRLLGKGK